MVSNLNAGKTSAVDQSQESGPWDPALAQLRKWDPTWAATCVKMTTESVELAAYFLGSLSS